MATGDPILISNFNQDDFFGQATRLDAFAKGALLCCFQVEKRPRAAGASLPETAIVGRALDGGTGVHGVCNNALVGGEGVRGSGPVGVFGDARAFGLSIGVRGMGGQRGTGVAGSGERFGLLADGGEAGVLATGTGPTSSGVTASGIAVGVLGQSAAASSVGVAGRSAAGTGVTGQSTTGAGMIAEGATVGISADARGGTGAVAVRALCRFGTSLEAWTRTGYVMRARSDQGEGIVVGARFHGVLGSSDLAIGVRGQSFGPNPLGVRRAGVSGESDRHPGVLGISQSGAGVEADSSTGTALLAHTQQGVGAHITAGLGASGAPGLPLHVEAPVAPGQNRPGRAANFIGDVLVRGDLVVGGVKSAVVTLADGTQRRLYCVEMPEPWVEDAGEVQLVRGRARVKLDRMLRRCLKTYQVFLSVYGPHDAYVARRGRDGFEIRMRGDAPAGRVSCGWRVLARRTDVDAPRFARLRRAPEPSEVADAPPVPKRPALLARSRPRAAALPRLKAVQPPKLSKPQRLKATPPAKRRMKR